MNTNLLYLANLDSIHCAAHVVEITNDDTRVIIILDQTVFYPQGGGQPYDTGRIENSSGTFIVTEVRFVDGVVKHIGKFEHGFCAVGDAVQCKVTVDRRNLNTRLHSAGHLIDMAVAQLNLAWVPGKAFHFPEGAYVEYAGDLEGIDKEALLQNIQDVCKELIAANMQTTITFMNKEQMNTVCHFVSPYIPDDKPGRVVMYGSFGIPCGGTHVKCSADVKDIQIRKIKMEKGNIRVSYDVTR